MANLCDPCIGPFHWLLHHSNALCDASEFPRRPVAELERSKGELQAVPCRQLQADARRTE